MNVISAFLVFSLFLAVKIYLLKNRKTSPKKTLISVCTFIAGIYFFLEFFLPKDFWGEDSAEIHSTIVDGLVLMGAMAIGLGVINLLRVHTNNILKSKKGWTNSVALILGMFLTFYVQFFDFFTAEDRNFELDRLSIYRPFITQIEKDFKEKKTPKAARLEFLTKELESLQVSSKLEESPFQLNEEDKDNDKAKELIASFDKSLGLAVKSTKELQKNYASNSNNSKDAVVKTEKTLQELYRSAFEISDYKYQNSFYKEASDFITQALFVPLGAAMFSLLAFFVSSAAYRSFRIKTLEAGIMMVAALIVILGQIPFGPLYIYSGLPSIREWLLEYISNPAFRAILFGSLVAGLAMAIRMWLSLEESPLESTEGS